MRVSPNRARGERSWRVEVRARHGTKQDAASGLVTASACGRGVVTKMVVLAEWDLYMSFATADEQRAVERRRHDARAVYES